LFVYTNNNISENQKNEDDTLIRKDRAYSTDKNIVIPKDSIPENKILEQKIPFSSQTEKELEAAISKNDSKTIKIETIIIDSVESGNTFELNNLLFDTDSYELLNDAREILDLFAIYLRNNNKYNIHIEGHTDDLGDANANLLLSQKRALEVKAYLIQKEISAERLEAIGFGETQPKVPNSSNANRKINRRTECRISIH
jgi:outer membrane protein OmpA-like peptidoglycan-associated protein